MAPPCERCLRSVAAQSPSRTLTAPRITSEWPESALVALYIAASAPRSSGRCPSGVASVLSTASRAPAAWAASATAAMSQTASAGFDGVSTQTSVAPSHAATIASVSVGTKRTSTPRGASRSFATLRTPG
jgi:hypothetical protein